MSVTDDYDVSENALRRIFSYFSNKLGGEFPPANYVVLDTETTGLDRVEDRVIELGMAVVSDKKLKWRSSDYIRVPEEAMSADATAVHGITSDILNREGGDSQYIFDLFVSQLDSLRAMGFSFVGHNFIGFDGPFLENECKRHGHDISFGPNEVVDTGMLVKAARLRLVPYEGMSLRDFFYKVYTRRARGVYYNLPKYCIKRFGLEKLGVQMENTHSAGYDAWISHLVLEELRRMAASTTVT